MDLSERETVAEKVAAAVTASGRGVGKVWCKGDHVRVYVARDLSRRAQQVGYIGIEEDGSRNYNPLDRNKAGIRDDVEAALAPAAV